MCWPTGGGAASKHLWLRFLPGKPLSFHWLFPWCLRPARLTTHSRLEQCVGSGLFKLPHGSACQKPASCCIYPGRQASPAALRKQITVQCKVLACFLSRGGSAFKRKVSCHPLHPFGLFYLSPPAKEGIRLLPRAGQHRAGRKAKLAGVRVNNSPSPSPPRHRAPGPRPKPGRGSGNLICFLSLLPFLCQI